MPGPRFVDPCQLARVRPLTVERYREAASLFVEWADGFGFKPSTAEEWDDLLVEFRFSQASALSRPKFTQVVSAVEFFFPRYRGKLAWAHAVINGWTAANPIRHTVPMGKAPAKLVGAHFSAWGRGRMGVGIILQSLTGMRPSEMLGILPEHVLLPEEQGSSLDVRPASIVLGPRLGTKVKRPQVVLLGPALADLVHILRLLKRLTPPDCPLFPYALPTYRAWIKRAEAALGLSVGWAPHSPRAGFASDSRAEGWSFQEVREAGRWQSDSSLRTYLDIVAASQIAVSLRAAGLAPALREVSESWWRHSAARPRRSRTFWSRTCAA